MTQQWCLHGNNKYGKPELVIALPAWVACIYELQYNSGVPWYRGAKISKNTWNRDALPFTGSWLHLAVVDPGNDLCYFNCSGSGQNDNKRVPPGGL
jgi:hypothetical protein